MGPDIHSLTHFLPPNSQARGMLAKYLIGELDEPPPVQKGEKKGKDAVPPPPGLVVQVVSTMAIMAVCGFLVMKLM